MKTRLIPFLCVIFLFACAEKLPLSPTQLPAEATQSQVLAMLESKEDFLLLDVRSTEEFAESHISGAVNIPHDQINENLTLLTPYESKNIVVYCRSGRRAQIAIDALKQQGFHRVSHLQGDFQQWQANELPLTEQQVKSSPVE
ncbi:rhodanese-like domain-containing protein [Thalassotalea mangrovi]|uniref:Rhodanese-like domain-containing protein n=1 Tax=Thalassotalea mangrovi TaxID=2572245 RepID=A0A4U1BBA1_9GAMM|nr:rhodanese-like domain-containing protein [Thalassotalea mangrovi]TKB47852.1 rhodanese-like domain-containing protein [Thalassotalea mangrovi]